VPGFSLSGLTTRGRAAIRSAWRREFDCQPYEEPVEPSPPGRSKGAGDHCSAHISHSGKQGFADIESPVPDFLSSRPCLCRLAATSSVRRPQDEIGDRRDCLAGRSDGAASASTLTA